MKDKKNITPRAEELQKLHEGSDKKFMSQVLSDKNLEEAAKKIKNSKLPEPLLLLSDGPKKPPKITQHELLEAANAFYIFQLAKADYEAKRSALVLKFLQDRHVEKGYIEAKIEPDGVITLTDWSSSGPALVYKLI